MDGSVRLRAGQLANEFAGQETTAEEISGLMRLMMKSASERMLNTELDVHMGRSAPTSSVEACREFVKVGYKPHCAAASRIGVCGLMTSSHDSLMQLAAGAPSNAGG